MQGITETIEKKKKWHEEAISSKHLILKATSSQPWVKKVKKQMSMEALSHDSTTGHFLMEIAEP